MGLLTGIATQTNNLSEAVDRLALRVSEIAAPEEVAAIESKLRSLRDQVDALLAPAPPVEPPVEPPPSP